MARGARAWTPKPWPAYRAQLAINSRPAGRDPWALDLVPVAADRCLVAVARVPGSWCRWPVFVFVLPGRRCL